MNFNLDDDLFDDESEIEEPEEYFDKLKESNKKNKLCMLTYYTDN